MLTVYSVPLSTIQLNNDQKSGDTNRNIQDKLPAIGISIGICERTYGSKYYVRYMIINPEMNSENKLYKNAFITRHRPSLVMSLSFQHKSKYFHSLGYGFSSFHYMIDDLEL
jgi:hypothetical protein